jgi:metallo-beta-lactamase family protein
VFSGDVGRDNDALMYPPKLQKQIMCFLKVTYEKPHTPISDVKLELEMYINNTVENGGTVIIPSFAVSERKW